MGLLIFVLTFIGLCVVGIAAFVIAFLAMEALTYLIVCSSDRVFAFYNKYEHKFDKCAYYGSVAVAALVMFLILQAIG